VPWNNGPIKLYHGTDDNSAILIQQHGVDLSHCKTLTDFGQGFYLTTNLVQAKNWANTRCRLMNLKNVMASINVPHPIATVISCDFIRDQLASLEVLVFVTENTSPDFWDLIKVCRQTAPPAQHKRQSPANNYYDVVFGPVTLWPQTLVIKDCDQISFHSKNSLNCLPASSFSTTAQQSASTPLFQL
jgi:hypothetical protein